MDSADPKSYRPISNLSVISKLLERLVSQQLLVYTLRKITCCQVVNQPIELITRRKPLSSEFCQTFCSPWTLGTWQSWHCFTCQLLLTVLTTQRCSVCGRLTVLEDLSLPGLHHNLHYRTQYVR